MAARSFRPDRLKRRADFLAARSGVRVHKPAFVLQILDRGEELQRSSRVGFTVTKKTGNAVVRNRIKRRLRAMTEAIDWPTDLSQHDVVVIARKEAESMDFSALSADFQQGLQEALKKLSRSSVANGRNTGQNRRVGTEASSEAP